MEKFLLKSTYIQLCNYSYFYTAWSFAADIKIQRLQAGVRIYSKFRTHVRQPVRLKDNSMGRTDSEVKKLQAFEMMIWPEGNVVTAPGGGVSSYIQ